MSYASVSWVNAQGEPESLELSGAEAAELYWNCILPDMQDGNIGLVWYAGAGAENSEVYDCRVSMELVKRGAAGRGLRLFLHLRHPPLRADQRLASGARRAPENAGGARKRLAHKLNRCAKARDESPALFCSQLGGGNFKYFSIFVHDKDTS